MTEDVVKYVFNDQVAVASMCLDAGLHNGRLGTMHGILDEIWDGHKPSQYKVVALEVNGRLVGCAVHHKRTNKIMAYVKPTLRRKGYGTELIRALEHLTGLRRDKFQAELGEDGSEVFWSVNDVIVYEDITLTNDETQQVISGELPIRKLITRKRREFRRAWLDRFCTPQKE